MEVTNANALRASTMVILKSQFQQLLLAPPPIKLELHWWSHSKKLCLLSYSVQSSLIVYGSSKVKNNNNNNFLLFLSLTFSAPIFSFSFSFLLQFGFLSLCFFFLPSFLWFMPLQITLPHPPTQTTLSLSLSPTMPKTIAVMPIDTVPTKKRSSPYKENPIDTALC